MSRQPALSRPLFTTGIPEPPPMVQTRHERSMAAMLLLVDRWPRTQAHSTPVARSAQPVGTISGWRGKAGIPGSGNKKALSAWERALDDGDGWIRASEQGGVGLCLVRTTHNVRRSSELPLIGQMAIESQGRGVPLNRPWQTNGEPSIDIIRRVSEGVDAELAGAC